MNNTRKNQQFEITYNRSIDDYDVHYQVAFVFNIILLTFYAMCCAVTTALVVIIVLCKLVNIILVKKYIFLLILISSMPLAMVLLYLFNATNLWLKNKQDLRRLSIKDKGYIDNWIKENLTADKINLSRLMIAKKFELLNAEDFESVKELLLNKLLIDFDTFVFFIEFSNALNISYCQNILIKDKFLNNDDDYILLSELNELKGYGIISEAEFDLKCVNCKVLIKPKTKTAFILSSCKFGVMGGFGVFLFILLLNLVGNR